MSKTYSKTRTLVECALMIALGTVLANIKIYSQCPSAAPSRWCQHAAVHPRSRSATA